MGKITKEARINKYEYSRVAVWSKIAMSGLTSSTVMSRSVI